MRHLLIFTALFSLWTAAAAQNMPAGNENDPGRHWTPYEVCPPTPMLHHASRHDFDRHDGGNDLATRRGLRGSDTDRDDLLLRLEQQDDGAQRVAPQTAGETFTVDGIQYRVNSDDNAVEVDTNVNINGDVSIPQSVYHNGKYYPVTSIGNGAFYRCSGLTSINIPNSVTSIGEWAFSDCSGLKASLSPTPSLLSDSELSMVAQGSQASLSPTPSLLSGKMLSIIAQASPASLSPTPSLLSGKALSKVAQDSPASLSPTLSLLSENGLSLTAQGSQASLSPTPSLLSAAALSLVVLDSPASSSPTQSLLSGTSLSLTASGFSIYIPNTWTPLL